MIGMFLAGFTGLGLVDSSIGFPSTLHRSQLNDTDFVRPLYLNIWRGAQCLLLHRAQRQRM